MHKDFGNKSNGASGITVYCLLFKKLAHNYTRVCYHQYTRNNWKFGLIFNLINNLNSSYRLKPLLHNIEFTERMAHTSDLEDYT